ncbi:MAG: transcription termination factor NusA [Fibromonadaceae bacterium]|jgi:N utilization substance protein A|nr:transcription termination factor NusA [Fibromonadaceae bacterium]
MAKKTAKKTNEVKEALELLAKEKNVAIEEVFGAFKESLVVAARQCMKLHKNIEVDVDPVTEDIQVVLRVEVVEDFPDYDPNMTAEDVRKMDENYMLEDEAKEYHAGAEAGYMLEVTLPFEKFGRYAIQEARNRLKHRINEVERNRIFENYKNKIGTLINGQVLRIEKNNAIISIGSTEAILTNSERMSKDRWKIGQSVKAVISGISEPSKGVGAQVTLSRVNKDFVRELFRQEIPEVYDGTIEIKGIARIPGYRAKVAVYSRDDRVDPSGACIGVKGQRIQAITRELNNERIDVVHWDPDPDLYLRRALSATSNVNIIKSFEVPDFSPPRTIVIVGDEDVGVVIGDKGQAVRLAGQLFSKEICVFSETDWSSLSEEERENLMHSQDPRIVSKRAASLDTLFNKSEDIAEDTTDITDITEDTMENTTEEPSSSEAANSNE